MKYRVTTENGKQVLTPVEGGQLSKTNGNLPAVTGSPLPVDGQIIEIIQHVSAEGNRFFGLLAETAKSGIPTHGDEIIEIIFED